MQLRAQTTLREETQKLSNSSLDSNEGNSLYVQMNMIQADNVANFDGQKLTVDGVCIFTEPVHVDKFASQALPNGPEVTFLECNQYLKSQQQHKSITACSSSAHEYWTNAEDISVHSQQKQCSPVPACNSSEDQRLISFLEKYEKEIELYCQDLECGSLSGKNDLLQGISQTITPLQLDQKFVPVPSPACESVGCDRFQSFPGDLRIFYSTTNCHEHHLMAAVDMEMQSQPCISGLMQANVKDNPIHHTINIIEKELQEHNMLSEAIMSTEEAKSFYAAVPANQSCLPCVQPQFDLPVNTNNSSLQGQDNQDDSTAGASATSVNKRLISGTPVLSPYVPSFRSGKKQRKANNGIPQPVRPLSAYNYFFSDERQRIISGKDFDTYDDEKKQHLLLQHLTKDRSKTRRHRKSHGKINFTSLSRVIGQRWKLLPEYQKQFYRDVAASDSERYRLECLGKR